MRKTVFPLIIASLVIVFMLPGFPDAKGVGLVVHLKGEASTLREARTYKLSLKDSVLLEDRVETAKQTRIKMLFDDDSMITLGESSRLIIREYYSQENKRGKTVMSLIEGRVKSLVGRNELEVHTPTALTAARGTYFIVWIETIDGTPVTNVTVLEGRVEVFNIDPAIKGMVLIEPGTMTRVFEKRPPEPPAPVPAEVIRVINSGAFDSGEKVAAKEETAPGSETASSEKDTGTTTSTAMDVAADSPLLTGDTTMGITQDLPVTQPIESQPPPNTTKVRIRVQLPQGILK